MPVTRSRSKLNIKNRLRSPKFSSIRGKTWILRRHTSQISVTANAKYRRYGGSKELFYWLADGKANHCAAIDEPDNECALRGLAQRVLGKCQVFCEHLQFRHCSCSPSVV